MEIPIQLKNFKFCRIKKGTKKPFERDWVNKPLSIEEISKFQDENYGVLCGYEGLVVIDCDTNELKEAIIKSLPETFIVKTGGGGTHFYYVCKEIKKKIVLQIDKKHFGEVQSQGTQVVGAGSLHPNGNIYLNINEKDIVEINKEQLTLAIKPFIKEIKEEEIKSLKELKNYGKSDINSISMLSVISISGFKKAANGEFYGSNPWHGSSTGMNFWINPSKNLAHCFRCDCGINVAQAIALNESIIKNCGEKLSKDNFIRVLEIAQNKYGLEKPEQKKENVIEEKEKDSEENTQEIVLMSKFNPVNYAKQICKISRFIYDKNKIFWRYDSESGIWKDDADQFIKTYLRNRLMGDEQQKKNYVEEVVAYIRDSVYDGNFLPNLKPTLIAFNNKIYDLENDKFLGFSSDYFITNKLNINIDYKIKECPLIDKFLEDCIGKEYKDILYDLASYTLFRGYPYPKVFFIFGPPKSGKSKYLTLLERFIGKGNHCMVEPQNIQLDKHSMSRMWLKLANIVSDINYDALDNINQIKKLTGEDSVNIRKMYHEGFEDVLYAKQIFSTNKLPMVKEKTNAWYRRVYLIPFINIIEDNKVDPFIIDKITNERELQGFAWQCLKHLKRLYLNNFIFSHDINIQVMSEIYENLSNPISLFIKESCTEGKEEFVYLFDFKDRLSNWLQENHFPPMTSMEINEYMRSKYTESSRIAPSDFNKVWRVWSGLRWKNPKDTSLPNHSYQINEVYKRVYIYRESFETPVDSVDLVKQNSSHNQIDEQNSLQSKTIDKI